MSKRITLLRQCLIIVLVATMWHVNALNKNEIQPANLTDTYKEACVYFDISDLTKITIRDLDTMHQLAIGWYRSERSKVDNTKHLLRNLLNAYTTFGLSSNATNQDITTKKATLLLKAKTSTEKKNVNDTYTLIMNSRKAPSTQTSSTTQQSGPSDAKWKTWAKEYHQKLQEWSVEVANAMKNWRDIVPKTTTTNERAEELHLMAKQVINDVDTYTNFETSWNDHTPESERPVTKDITEAKKHLLPATKTLQNQLKAEVKELMKKIAPPTQSN